MTDVLPRGGRFLLKTQRRSQWPSLLEESPRRLNSVVPIIKCREFPECEYYLVRKPKVTLGQLNVIMHLLTINLILKIVSVPSFYLVHCNFVVPFV